MAIALDIGTYSDISDYRSLMEKAKLWLDRGDELDELFPTFVANVEGHLNRVLRTPEMEAFTPIVAAGGAFSLPTDCLQVRGVYLAGNPLEATSPAALGGRYVTADGRWAPGCPSAFAITGRSVQIAPVADQPVGLSYWRRIPAITTLNPTNWLLDNHADIYLKGVLFEAYTYIVDTDAAANWSTLFDAAVATLQDNGIKARYGGPIVARSGMRQVPGARA